MKANKGFNKLFFILSFICIFSNSCKDDEKQSIAIELPTPSITIYGSSFTIKGLINYNKNVIPKEIGLLYDTIENTNIENSKRKSIIPVSDQQKQYYITVDSLNSLTKYYCKIYIKDSENHYYYSTEQNVVFNSLTTNDFTPIEAFPDQIVVLSGNNFGNYKELYEIYFGTEKAEIISLTENTIKVKVPNPIINEKIESFVKITIINNSKKYTYTSFFTYKIYEPYSLNSSSEKYPIFSVNGNVYACYHYDGWNECKTKGLFIFDTLTNIWKKDISMQYYRVARVAMNENTGYFLFMNNCPNSSSWDYAISSFQEYDFKTNHCTNLSFPFIKLYKTPHIFWDNHEEDLFNRLFYHDGSVFMAFPNTNDSCSLLSNIWKFNTKTNEWNPMNNCPISGASFKLENYIYVFSKNSMYKYDINFDCWIEISAINIPESTFGSFSCLELGKIAYFIDNTNGKVWRFDSESLVWQKTCQLPSENKYGNVFLYKNNIMVTIGADTYQVHKY